MNRWEPRINSAFLEGLERLGRPSAPLDEDIAKLLEPSAAHADEGPGTAKTISLPGFARLLESASRRLSDPCFGLRFAKIYPAGATGAVGYLLLNAPDLRTMVACIRRFIRLHVDAVEITSEESGGRMFLSIGFGPSLNTPHQQLIAFLMGLFALRSHRLIGEPLKFQSVSFAFSKPECVADYEELFGPNLTFDAGRNCFVLPNALLRARGVESDDRLFKLLSGIAEQELQRINPLGGITSDLGSYILKNLPLDGVSMEAAAAAFGLTVRELHAELRRLGTSFDAEVTRTRRQMAERYLRDTDLPMTQIAFMLGFSELSAFTRAARGWFDRPPTEMRVMLRGASPKV